jgi:transcriptional regulator with XRE-family HTH domain
LSSNYIADNLRYLRKRKGVTQTEVAKAHGVPATTYNAYETGQNVPRDDMKLKIADYYGRSVQFIFFKQITH